ncbi:MAG TPA: MarR family transcriptional regulator [Planctomycetota bacterium]|jgi:DNA-binding transcriptional regulator GbsR (MarR family)
MTDTNKLKLSAVQERFVLHWGEMGARWGINRTVAQIHALLYVAPRPLNAEEISATLSVARSNVSTSLRELLSWGIIRTVRVLGDRRDHFESLPDVWEMFRRVLEGRKKREMDPTVAVLREAVGDLRRPGERDARTEDRLRALLEFFETASVWYERFRSLPLGAIGKVGRIGSGLKKLFGRRA